MPPTVISVDPAVIEISSDEDEDSRPPKRQKKDTKPAPKPSTSTSTMSNSHLKGRKRFAADMSDMKKDSQEGFAVQGLTVRYFRQGEDEGSIAFKIIHEETAQIVSVSLLVSDTSEYPSSHNFFAFSPDVDVPHNIVGVLEDVANGSSKPIKETIERLLVSVSKKIGGTMAQASHQSQEDEASGEEDEDDGDGSEDYYGYDEDDFVGPSTGSADSAMQMQRLQRDFVETVATGYLPALTRWGTDDFALSVAYPVIKLADDIPPRALMAWDRTLLSETQHLTLLISGMRGCFPPLNPDGNYTADALRKGTALVFKVGLTRRYKPGIEEVTSAVRNFALVAPDIDEVSYLQEKQDMEGIELTAEYSMEPPQEEEVPEEENFDRFDKFALSNSLETLLDARLLSTIQYRRKFGLGWAGAEYLVSEVERLQRSAADIYNTDGRACIQADRDEQKLQNSYTLPFDPLSDPKADINLPLTAFCYLIRRLSLCTRFCLVCHNTLKTDFEALKPYVCDSKLCAYQYYSLNRGASLEYEIRKNPMAVDLLVSITYVAAMEHAILDPLPLGLGLRVPVPNTAQSQPINHQSRFSGQPPAAAVSTDPSANRDIPREAPEPNSDGLCDLDAMDNWQIRASIANLIDSIPPIEDIKKFLEKPVRAGKKQNNLKDMDPNILPAAWSVLRWVVASATAYLEPLEKEEERVRNLGPGVTQFRFSVGAPNAEAKFKTSQTLAQQEDKNANKYPSLFAFHGSAVKNWHSIIRHGLLLKEAVNGRAYGHGVYFAKDAQISMGHYATVARTSWKNSKVCPSSVTAIAEITNHPSKFVSTNPYFVVANTEWIVCRYLLVKGSQSLDAAAYDVPLGKPKANASASDTPMVSLDPAHPLLNSATKVLIPEPSHPLETILEARRLEYVEEDFDAEDAAIFEVLPEPELEPVAKAPPAKKKRVVENEWVHDADWVSATLEHLMPAPQESTPSATMAVQRELSRMLKEQDSAESLSELGWYLPQEFIGDNLFQWIIELHSFDKDLPIAKDMKKQGLNSVIFEIRFPGAYPISPPFFRIIKPRFLPFIHGGGGHITGGGSICMDLLTPDGWLPSYSISAILLQIKLAISNPDPKPARLANNWDTAYSVPEALEGYKRAARTHNWTLPPGLDQLVR